VVGQAEFGRITHFDNSNDQILATAEYDKIWFEADST